MRHPLLATIVLLFSLACVRPLERVPETMRLTAFDFSGYSDRGFMFTPDRYTGEYDSIGMISLTYAPEANEEDRVEILRPGGKASYTVWVVSPLDPEKAVAEMYRVCVEMGANALTEIEIRWSTTTSSETKVPVSIPTLEISGFAIRRLGVAPNESKP